MKIQILFLIFLCSSWLQGQNLEIYVDSLMQNEIGAAVLVMKKGNVHFEKTYGVHHLEKQNSITSTSNFRMASVSKQFTATAIMILMDEGKLSPETQLSEVFPDFPNYGKQITIRQLLQHTSGLPDYTPYFPRDLNFQLRDMNILEMVYRTDSLDFQSGSKWEYSNTAYVLLGMIVEKVSDIPFYKFVENRILIPLGMVNSCFYVEGLNQIPDRVFGHVFNKDQWELRDQSIYSSLLGDGGLYTSLEEIKLWLANMKENKLLSKEIAEAMLKDVFPVNEVEDYGYGIRIGALAGNKKIYHTGSTSGFRNCVQWFPDVDLQVVVFTNSGTTDAPAIADKIARFVLVDGE